MVDFLLDIGGDLFPGAAGVGQSEGILCFKCIWEIYSARYPETP